MEQDYNIIIIADKKERKKILKGIKGIDSQGNLETQSLSDALDPNKFAKFDKTFNPITLAKNFWNNLTDPSNYVYYGVPSEKYQQDVKTKDLKPFDISNLIAEKIKNSKDLSATIYDEKKIDWENLAKFGITKETLEKNNSLQTMVKGYGSRELINIKFQINGVQFEGMARAFLNQTNDESLDLKLKGKIDSPNFDNFHGENFSEEERKTMLKTGNLGRIATLKFKDGTDKKAFVSVDSLTNRLTYFKAESLNLKDSYREAKLTEEQKSSLLEGKAIYLTGMRNKNGNNFDSYVQINAETKGIALVKNRERQQAMKEDLFPGIPKTFGKQLVTERQREILADNGTIFLSNVQCRDGEARDAFFRKNEQGQIKFYDASERGNYKLFKEVVQSETKLNQKHQRQAQAQTNSEKKKIIKKNSNTQEVPNKNTQKKGRKL